MMSPVDFPPKFRALARAAGFRPRLTVGVIVLSFAAALLEGIGLSFLLPIIELAQGEIRPGQASGILGVFVTAYGLLGIPFELGYLVLGISAIMTVRYTASFLVGWLRGTMTALYIRHLQRRAFEHALVAEVSYFDREGSDDILNAIVTQAEYAGGALRLIIEIVEKGLLGLMYLSIALYLSPVLTVLSALIFGVLTYLFRVVLESGYAIGGRIASANERIQQHAQAGTQGIRDVKLFGLTDELVTGFNDSVDEFYTSSKRYYRNKSAIRNYFRLSTAITLFALVYVAIAFSVISLGALGVFLFAMFRLGPTVSSLNSRIYEIEEKSAHLVRTQEFLDELEQRTEPSVSNAPVPESVESVSFENVWFSYDTEEETVLRGLSFGVERGEFVAFVGPSGAGKSTIVSLLARLYEPDEGSVLANGVDIAKFDIAEWRSKVSVVRQNPYMFNDTLRRNVTVGERNATDDEVRRACEIAQVTEFLGNLPDGLDTHLGDDGVRLSGGQRQRVSIARAILKDADLLILDEATSDLDTSLEERVHGAIESLDREYAIVVIAHRLSTVTNADRIYTMRDGRIIETGRHQELIQNDGTYSELYAMQSH